MARIKKREDVLSVSSRESSHGGEWGEALVQRPVYIVKFNQSHVFVDM